MNSVAVKEDHAGMDQPRKTALPECDHDCLRSAFLALAERRVTRTLTGHHRSAAKEAVADGKETTEKSETARSQGSVAVARPGPGEVGGLE
jgi:hypothetical protein